MRLAILASGFADYSLELAAALAQRHTVTVLVDRAALAREGRRPPPGVALRPFDQADLWSRWSSARRLDCQLAEGPPDALIAHEHPHPHLTWLMRRWSRRGPLWLIVHDPEPHPGRDAAFAQAHRREVSAQRRLARRLFVHGAACAEALSAADPGLAATVIAHGPILRPEAVQPPPGERRILMFGRMEAYKGLDVLLAACNDLALRGTDFRLEVLGAGPELDRLHRPFATLPACTVHRGFAPREALQAALARADLVVAPYLHATQSGVVAAAFANGRPVVASGIGGLSEVIRPGVNGFLSPPGDPAALAHALARGLAATGLWQGAKRTAEVEIDWDKAVAQMIPALAAVA